MLDCERAMRFYRMGLNDNEIAERCSVRRQAVANWRCRSCLPSNSSKPARKITPLEWEAVQARKHGVTYGEWRSPAFKAERKRLLEEEGPYGTKNEP